MLLCSVLGSEALYSENTTPHHIPVLYDPHSQGKRKSYGIMRGQIYLGQKSKARQLDNSKAFRVSRVRQKRIHVLLNFWAAAPTTLGSTIGKSATAKRFLFIAGRAVSKYVCVHQHAAVLQHSHPSTTY
jgi:hypothetical protein